MTGKQYQAYLDEMSHVEEGMETCSREEIVEAYKAVFTKYFGFYDAQGDTSPVLLKNPGLKNPEVIDGPLYGTGDDGKPLARRRLDGTLIEE